MSKSRKRRPVSPTERVLATSLRAIRQRIGLKQSALASALNISEAQMCAIELAKHKPAPGLLWRWADILTQASPTFTGL